MFVVTVDAEACTGCGECARSCPAQILVIKEGKVQVVGDDCLGCQSCEMICPAAAIKPEEY